jgi:hypothetical protein
VIGCGGTIVDFTDPMDHSRIEKNPLGERSLSRVDMRSNPNVPCPLKRNGTSSGLRDFAHQTSGKKKLEAEMGEGTVSLSHFMHIIALADRVAGVIGSILDLVGEGDMHGGALFGTRKSDNPTHAEGLGAIGVYL